jgi:hypothetical protein
MAVTKSNAYDIYVEACAAAQKAAAECTPQPMYVGTAKSIFGNEIDETQPVYKVASGICGRASVVIRPARGAFVTALKARQVGYSGYYGGYEVPSYQFGAGRSSQSYEIAKAAAQAAAAVLDSYGIKAYVNASLD